MGGRIEVYKFHSVIIQSVRSISKIKEIVDKRDSKSSIIVKKLLKTPGSIREDQKKDDPILKEQSRLRSQYRDLEKVITKNTKKLDQINTEIVDRADKAIISGDSIIEAAKIRADNIVANALVDKHVAEGMLVEVKKQAQDLSKFEKELKILDSTLNTRQENVNSKEKSAKIFIEKAQKMDQSSLEKVKEAQTILDDMMGLFLIVVDKVASISNVSDSILKILSSNMEKVGNIYIESKKIRTIIEFDKDLNKERSDKLDKKEIWLKDRRSSLTRVEREIKK